MAEIYIWLYLENNMLKKQFEVVLLLPGKANTFDLPRQFTKPNIDCATLTIKQGADRLEQIPSIFVIFHWNWIVFQLNQRSAFCLEFVAAWKAGLTANTFLPFH